jgi:ornithine cyclodeaminase/alanine dehydrogenase-like protein (mu-crystallin family)
LHKHYCFERVSFSVSKRNFSERLIIVPATKVLYLSHADVAAINLAMAEIIDAVEFALVEKAHGRTDLPPKHWIPTSNRRFFSAMTSSVPASGSVVCKWQSGSTDNAALGLPYLTGLLMLNDIETGLIVAVMDSTWITSKRTAAASAVAVRHLANPGTEVLGIIGCGLQGRIHVEAILAVCPELQTVRAYDIVPEVLSKYALEIHQTYGLDVVACSNAREVAAGAQVVVTGGIIEPDTERVMEPGWLERGALGIAIDYDCYWKPSAMQTVDGFFTDDVGQMEHLKEYGYFVEAPAATAELGAVAAGLNNGRGSSDEILLTMNMGVAVEDVVMARRVYGQAREADAGIWLDL